MEKTNIEHFNSYLKQFIENIIETFDEYKDNNNRILQRTFRTG